MTSNHYFLERIKPADNASMAAIIRQGLTEFGANRPGFAWQDPELDALSNAYAGDFTAYWVISGPKGLVGGCGVASVL